VSKKVKIQITSWLNGSVLFEYESVDNTIAKTLEKAVSKDADLRYANLSYANLSSANLSYADLRYANLRYANLSYANLRYADLRYANLSSANLSYADLRYADLRYANLSYANLRYANLSSANLSSANLSYANLRSANLRSALTLMGCALRGCKLKNLPPQFINICSRDMLFIFNHLKKELPGLRKALVEGRVDGSQYEGECACLIGTLANLDGGLTEVCSAIPYYEKDAANPGETWFLAISEGDTPKNNEFSKHAVMLIDTILKPKKVKKTPKSNQEEQ